MIKKIFLWLSIFALIGIAFVVSVYYAKYLDVYLFFTIPALLAAWVFNFWSGFLVASINLSLLFYLNLTYKIWKAFPFMAVELSVRFLLMIALIFLVDRVRVKLATIELESRNDNLTELLNRRGLFEFGEYEIERAFRTKEPFSVVVMDVDNFKQINDTLGHLAGDEVLKNIGKILHRHLRKMDAAARFGGDEFALILPLTDSQLAKMVVDRIVASINKKLPTSPPGISLTVGCCTMVTHHQLNFKTLFKSANDLMYEAKRAGKNKIVYKEI